MFSVSGFGFSNPQVQGPRKSSTASGTSAAREKDPLIIEDDPCATLRHPCGELIHPATAPEFREPLEEILSTLPFLLIQAIVGEGYCLHVVDTQNRFPLTLPLLAPDLQATQTLVWEGTYGELAVQRGATSVEEEDDWILSLETLNPHPGAELRVPTYHYWAGQRVTAAAWEFLAKPFGSFVAGMVTHGDIEGIEDENRIVFWDCAFERGDGLLAWYVLHEIGHTTDYSFAFRRPEAWRNWRERVQDCFDRARAAGHLITRYAGDSLHEYIAEGFAAWALQEPLGRGDLAGEDLAGQRLALDRAHLQALDPQLSTLLDEAVATLQSTCTAPL